MNPAAEVSPRGGQRHGRLSPRPVMQLNSALASRREPPTEGVRGTQSSTRPARTLWRSARGPRTSIGPLLRWCEPVVAHRVGASAATPPFRRAEI
jgi:hypothetical protein